MLMRLASDEPALLDTTQCARQPMGYRTFKHLHQLMLTRVASTLCRDNGQARLAKNRARPARPWALHADHTGKSPAPLRPGQSTWGTLESAAFFSVAPTQLQPPARSGK